MGSLGAGFKGLVASLALVAAGAAQAGLAVYSFEGVPDGALSSIGGLTFGNTVVLVGLPDGNTLNDFDFPPRSGTRVASDFGGAISISFSSSMTSVGAYFNYTAPLQLSFFDGSNALIGTQSSQFGSNIVSAPDFGSSINEFIGFTGTDIRRVTIEGLSTGFSFTMDDLTVSDGGTVPVPATLPLVLLALGVTAPIVRRRRD